MPKFTSETAKAAGSRGGKKTVERHGIEHMRNIGQKGLTAWANKHFKGDRAAALEWLRRKGLYAIDSRMRQDMPWMRPITNDPGTPDEFLEQRYGNPS